jgi:hypothetical protein
MANNAGFKFIFQRTAKTAPQSKPPDSPQSSHGTVRILMRDGKWLVQPSERPGPRNPGSGSRSSSD